MVFSGTPVFSTNKTDCHDITEILLKQYFSYIVAVSFIGGENWSTGENHRTVASH
jgi:hypothetical protein